jgi:hypothetical protein
MFLEHLVIIMSGLELFSQVCCVYQPSLSSALCSLHHESCHNNTGDSHGLAFLLHTEASLWGLLHSFLLLQSMYALHPIRSKNTVKISYIILLTIKKTMQAYTMHLQQNVGTYLRIINMFKILFFLNLFNIAIAYIILFQWRNDIRRMNGEFERAHGLYLPPIPTFTWNDSSKQKKRKISTATSWLLSILRNTSNMKECKQLQCDM